MFAFIAHGPGSANTMTSLFASIPRHLIQLVPMHEGVAKIWNTSKVYHSHKEVKYQPGTIFVYGTGSCNRVELDVPRIARAHGGISVSILDVFWAGDANLRRRFGASPPDYLIVPNEACRNTILRLALMPADRVFALGNPHFDRLLQYHVPSLELDGPFDVGFFSQCSTSGDYSDTVQACKNALISLIKYRDANPGTVNRIMICAHPREDLTWLKQMAKEHNLHWRPEGVNSFDCLLRLKVAVGVSSTVLYEGAMIGKAVVFYGNREDFNKKMQNLHTMKFSAGIQFDATAKVLNLLMKLYQRASMASMMAIG